MRRPWIKNKRLAIALGLVGFVASVLILYDAYERRGGRAPFFIRAFTPT